MKTPEVGSRLMLGEGTAPVTQQNTGLLAVGLPTEVGRGWVPEVIPWILLEGPRVERWANCLFPSVSSTVSPAEQALERDWGEGLFHLSQMLGKSPRAPVRIL